MDDLLGLETRALLDLLARRGRGPAVGSAAALVAATAAALVTKAARGSGDWEDGPAAAAQAEALRARTAPLAQADADAYAAAVARLDGPGEADAGRSDFQLGRALDAAALIPMRIAAASADVAALAAEVAERGNPELRPEAVGAALLAEAAARTAAHLVAVNLAVGAEDDRVREAEAHAEAATRSARRAGSL